MEYRTAATVSYARLVAAGVVVRFADLLPPSVSTDPGLDLDAEWRQHAACGGEDIEGFFPERLQQGSYSAEEQAAIEEVKQICAGCIVRAECAEYAREHKMHYGIWGGKPASERPGTRAYTNRQRTEKKRAERKSKN